LTASPTRSPRDSEIVHYAFALTTRRPMASGPKRNPVIR
jgi:hypothetical protein